MSVPVSQQEGAILAVAKPKYKAICLNDSCGQLLAILVNVSSFFKFVRLIDVLGSLKSSLKCIQIEPSSSLVSCAKREPQYLHSYWRF